MATGRQVRGTQATSIPTRAGSAKTAPKSEASTVDDSEITVTYGIQVTKKTGEFEFIKVNAEITVPLTISDADLARIDSKLVVLREKITDRIAGDLREIGL